MKESIDKDKVVNIPGSKSITHRAIICASLSNGKSIIKNFLRCEDTDYTIRALKSFGIDIYLTDSDILIESPGSLGLRHKHTHTKKRIYLGNSGTSFRLLLSVFAIAKGNFELTGTSRMCERPIGELVTALLKIGAKVSFLRENGFPPLYIEGRSIRGGKITISGRYSSQFVSSLLLISPCTEKGLELYVEGDVVSKPYIDITLDVMKRFGISFERKEYHFFKIRGKQTYKPVHFLVEGDVSSASYFWAAAAITKKRIITQNIFPFDTFQGDIKFLDILKEMGCVIEKRSQGVLVEGKSLRGIEVDMSSMPDMVPTLAAIAPFAEGTTIIRNVRHLRYKESDRLHVIATEWQKIGVKVKEIEDGLIIQGDKRNLKGTTLSSHNDHRIAMSLAVMGLRIPGIEIRDKTSVNKSFPLFWKLWADTVK